MAALRSQVVSSAELPVGFTNVNVPGNTVLRGDASNRLRVVLWYPTDDQTRVRPIEVGPPNAPYFQEGKGAVDAAVAGAPMHLPLIVVSHGSGGTAMDLAWLCVGLAARGYIVAAVDHPGDNALGPATVAGNTVWWMRADDLSHVIDGVLAMPRFGPRIDRARIGAAGISLGGYTVLVIAGARADRARLDPYCALEPMTPVCSGAATPAIPDLRAQASKLAVGDARYRTAIAANMKAHRDSRIKAVFSIEPSEGPAIIRKSLAAIDIPIAFVAGLGDEILPIQDNVIPDALAVPNAQVTLLPRPAGHFTFLIDCTLTGRQKYPALCGDAGFARLAVHRETLKLAAAFFARTLGPKR